MFTVNAGKLSGISAYEIWLSLGNTGTKEDFLATLTGPQGDPGNGVPAGGTTGQQMVKSGPEDYATGWAADNAVKYTDQGGSSKSDSERAIARGNLKTNLQTFTDASQIGITLDASTTLTQLATAMPNNSILMLVVSPSAGASLVPPNTSSLYGQLIVYKSSYTRISVQWHQVPAVGQVAESWTNFIASGDGGTTYTVYGWKRMTAMTKTGVTTITIPNGQQNASIVITFDSPAFKTIPMVFPILNTGYPGGKSVSLDGSVSPSTGSFKMDVGLNAAATADTPITIRWYALEVI